MYLTPHRHALGTTMNKRQESRKKNKPERGRSTELHRAIHPNRERRGHSLCAALKWGGGKGRVGWQGLLHMLTMDTGKSSKGHEGHRENIQLPETEGNLRLGFLAKHLTHPGPKQQKMLTRVGGRLCRAQGQSFLLNLGMALSSQKSKP